MKIGLLAYHSACNFGATLQLLSTYMYFKNAGYEPIIINWIASDLERYYQRVTPQLQYQLHEDLRKQLWKETALCRTSEDVAQVIEKEKIEAVVIGSDAVCQHHPLLERIIFPTRTIIHIQKLTSDRMFPSPFWGLFNRYLTKSVPVAVLSASSQDSAYEYIPCKIRKEMAEAVGQYRYMSVRDSWTADMIASITHQKSCPEVTPDPVFAFNYNAGILVPSKEEICTRFHLPERYILLSFIHPYTVSQAWLNEFEQLAEKHGIACVMLPFSHKASFGDLKHKIDLPLSPLEWYALIKYAAGYVGHNMHPIVVSLHNQTPFFSFDNYGIKKWNGFYASDTSSKIRHILGLANQSAQRISCIHRGFKAPAPAWILDKILHFDKTKSNIFAAAYYAKYQRMMQDIENAIK